MVIGVLLRFFSNLTLHKVSLKNNGLFYCNIYNEETNVTISDSVSVIGESGNVHLVCGNTMYVVIGCVQTRY